MTSSIPYSLISAFTDDAYAGNPAAVVFMDTHTPIQDLTKVARNFNQPMLVIVSPTPLPSEDPKVLVRDIRFIVTFGKDSAICGHGTLAAAKVIFDQPESIAKGIHTIEFHLYVGGVAKAIKLDDGSLEIGLPAASLQETPAEEKVRLALFINKAAGRNVVIKDVQIGIEKYEGFVLVELDEAEDLAKLTIDHTALLDNGYKVNVITTAATKSPGTAFVSRMFSPHMLAGGEDHVCGSAHCLLGPYWHKKQNLAPGRLIKAVQVSPRGGLLGLVWKTEENIIQLRGRCAIFATGTFFL